MARLTSGILKALLGLVVLGILALALFSLTRAVLHTWGSTAQERAVSLPGEELVSRPLVRWTHGITINAGVDRVWPWLAQMGDDRGGFYSYTFIENKVGALMGAGSYDVVYRNANRIVPEWQNPEPGLPIIQGSLKIRELRPGEYLLADSFDPQTYNWVWSWSLRPAGAGRTRLLVFFAIEVPESAGLTPALTSFMDLGGFVMERGMMDGIKLRAEGRSEPPWIEGVEIAVWLLALLAGIAAAVAYLSRLRWALPLVVAAASVVLLFVHTFVQPSLWLRIALDLLLVGAVIWSFSRRGAARAAELSHGGEK